MKLLDLYLRAFGPFTDRHLDLSQGKEGLHIVYGRNEAGKSTALRALMGLLYGIPERTEDDFLHRKSELRVGGRLRDDSGSEFLCYRRKGRKNTLHDGEGGVIPEEELTRVLGGIDERAFERLFGIDHASLVTGGQALLMERGREAEALFESGLGGNAVHAVLEQLDQEAQSLFAPRASRPLINAELSHLAALDRKQREASLPARQWDEARRTVNVVTRQLKDIDKQLVEAEKRRGALERIRRTLPALAKRAQIQQDLAELGDVAVLPEDFQQRRSEAEAKRRLAVDVRLGASARLLRLREESAGLTVAEELLAQADAIDDLRERLGSFRKDNRDRPDLIARHAAFENQVRQQLAQWRPDLSLARVGELRPLLGRRRRVTELATRQEALEAALKAAQNGLAQAESGFAAKRDALNGMPESLAFQPLQRAVEEARLAGDIDRSIDEVDLRFRQHDNACHRELATLGLWKGSLCDFLSAPLPGEEAVGRAADQLQVIEQDRRGMEEARSQARSEQLRAEESLQALQLTTTVPSEADLEKARHRRDEGWQLLRRQWIEGEEVTLLATTYANGEPLADAFEGAMAATDEVSDRLRREARRVHEQAAARAKIEFSARRISEAEAALERLRTERERLKDSWQDLWKGSGISPLPPRDMAQWLAKAARLREKSVHSDELCGHLHELQRVRNLHMEKLGTELAKLGERTQVRCETGTLTPLLEAAETRLRALEACERNRALLCGEIEEIENTVRRSKVGVEAAERELAGWRSEWTVLMRELGVADSTTAGEASDYLETIAKAITSADEASGLGQRIERIDADALQFKDDATAALTRLAHDLVGRPVGEAVLELHARLGRHREAKSRIDELQRQARLAEDEVREADVTIRRAVADLEELCRQAACEHPEQLELVEQRFQDYRRLVAAREEVEKELIAGGDGLGIDALRHESEDVDRDAVMAELGLIGERIERELRPEQEALLKRKVNAERDLAAMAGGDEASLLAESAQQTLSRIRTLAERYVRVKLAGRILREEIERYRRRHRDPILARASGYIERLTCGSLVNVETDFDAADEPILVGVRSSGERLGVEAMSTGTRDQLYLALRLATLDHFLDSATSLPFIVDDILIQFDDQRSQACLGALADFSAKVQVILFTHHAQVVEHARTVEDAKGRVFVHELN